MPQTPPLPVASPADERNKRVHAAGKAGLDQTEVVDSHREVAGKEVEKYFPAAADSAFKRNLGIVNSAMPEHEKIKQLSMAAHIHMNRTNEAYKKASDEHQGFDEIIALGHFSETMRRMLAKHKESIPKAYTFHANGAPIPMASSGPGTIGVKSVAESVMARMLGGSIGSAGEQGPRMYTTADFENADVGIATKIGNRVNFKISDGTHKVQSLEHDEPVLVPKGHVIVHRPDVDGDRPYAMSHDEFKRLHKNINYETGTAHQAEVTKKFIIAHEDGHTIVPWHPTPLRVRKGDILVHNGNHVGPVNNEVFARTYRIRGKGRRF